VIEQMYKVGAAGGAGAVQAARKKGTPGSFDAMLRQKAAQQTEGRTQTIQFSKHAMTRVEERGIRVTPDLMEKLAGSVEKAQAKGATNILAIDTDQAFIINVPYGRVITTMTQEEMKENFFTNIDGAVLL